VLAARIDKRMRDGRNAFLEYQLPQAVIALKQGAGRLIRDESELRRTDDLRSTPVTRSYGKRILAACPALTAQRAIIRSRAFLARI